jgi:hypothetical protein
MCESHLASGTHHEASTPVQRVGTVVVVGGEDMQRVDIRELSQEGKPWGWGGAPLGRELNTNATKCWAGCRQQCWPESLPHKVATTRHPHLTKDSKRTTTWVSLPVHV